jgi:hypothetical protein
VVLFGRCHTVEGKAKEVCGVLSVEAEREKERKRQSTWKCHVEKKRRGGPGTRDTDDTGRGPGERRHRDVITQSRGRGGMRR